MAYLPKIEVSGMTDPVIQVVDEYLQEVVYTIRIKGTSWRPKVFREATYTIRVGEGDRVRVFRGVESGPKEDSRVLKVRFDS
ncbi:MAG: hypothetical protein GXP27_08160 [Planctomycetes bacterium]|nr:hypothetical protein [Planctomycetota bacterium]